MPFHPPLRARSETRSSEGDGLRSSKGVSSLETLSAASLSVAGVSEASTEVDDETRDALRRLSQLIRKQAQSPLEQGEQELSDSVARQSSDAQSASDRARWLSDELRNRWRIHRGLAQYQAGLAFARGPHTSGQGKKRGFTPQSPIGLKLEIAEAAGEEWHRPADHDHDHDHDQDSALESDEEMAALRYYRAA